MAVFQDDIADAEEITELRGTISQDITDFTEDTGTPDPGDITSYQSGWIKLVVAEPSLALLDTIGSFDSVSVPPAQLDTQLAIYAGEPGDLSLIQQSDDAAATGVSRAPGTYPSVGSRMAVQLAAATYYVQASSYDGAAGILTFNWLITPLALHQSSGAVVIKDADGIFRPIEAVTTDDGQIRQVVLIGGLVSTSDLSNTLPVSETSVIAATPRAVSTNGPTMTRLAINTGFQRHGGDFVLNVTANPGGGETLSMKLQAQDNVSGAFVDWVDWGVVATASNGTFHCLCFPGAVAADAAIGTKVKGLPLPHQFRIVITHSAGGSWTYRLGWVPLD